MELMSRMVESRWVVWTPTTSWRLKVNQIFDLEFFAHTSKSMLSIGYPYNVKLRLGERWIGPELRDSIQKDIWLHHISRSSSVSPLFEFVEASWREFDEMGNAVDPDGNYPGGVEFSGFADLRDWMANRPQQFAHTLTEKLMTYALGRRVEYYDQPVIRRIVREAADKDFSWSSLIVGIVTSEPFLMRRSELDATVQTASTNN